MNWLFKEEPTHYGYDALVKNRKMCPTAGHRTRP